MLRRINRWITRATGVRVLRRAPHGLDLLDDLRRYGGEPRTIVDVGANVGQSALAFRHHFPAALIHSVEPVRATYDRLCGAVKGQRVTCHNLAISDRRGTAVMHVASRSVKSRIEEDARAGCAEEVERTTLTEFFDRTGIQHAEFVKTDTEGHEIAVIEGARPLLEARRIDFIAVEVGFSADRPRLVHIDRVVEALAPSGYRLFGIYGQRATDQPPYTLRAADALFAR